MSCREDATLVPRLVSESTVQDQHEILSIEMANLEKPTRANLLG
jgi:hypothetical protein